MRKTKNQIRRERLKLKKALAKEEKEENTEKQAVDEKELREDVVQHNSLAYDSVENTDTTSDRLFETETERLLKDPRFVEYKHILDKFRIEEEEPESGGAATQEDGQVFFSDDEETIDRQTKDNRTNTKIIKSESNDVEDSELFSDESNRPTKKLQRKLNKIPIVLLKQRAKVPQLVEWFDADAPDPDLVVQIKSSPNIVQVPDHWQNKREYLASKRGFKKAAFQLPEAIRQTGIMEMRDALGEDDQTLRQKMRERVQPKMGRLDIDYQKLHQAFFKYSTKPRLYGPGDVYYEGKESELDVSGFRPGLLSMRLKEALNIPQGAPPPWLLPMQKYGPPPGYPGLKIAGLTAPAPPGAQLGYHPGGWGRPLVDEKQLVVAKEKEKTKIEPVNREPWGLMIEEEEEEEEEEESEEDENEQEEGAESENESEAENEQNAIDRNGVSTYAYVDEEAALAAAQASKRPREPSVTSSNKKPKKLFEVLDETDASGFVNRAYSIPKNVAEQMDELIAEASSK